MHLFFLSEISGSSGRLDAEETRHCLKVMRLRVGDPVCGVDGRGNFYEGNISEFGRDYTLLRLGPAVTGWHENEGRISLCISVLHKPDRFEWLAEKAVELGVTELTPFVSNRTVKSGYRADRIQKIMVSAIKQSLRSRLPNLPPEPLPFPKLIAAPASGLRFIPWCEAMTPLGDHHAAIAQAKDVQFLIGPEGDFTPEEVQAASAAGFVPVSLGTARLRAETAALHVLSIVKQIQGF